MKENVKEIIIYAKEIAIKGTSRSFLKYSYLNSKGEFFDIKFNSEIANLEKPNKQGYWLIRFYLTDCNISKAKIIQKEDGTEIKGNRTIWFKRLMYCEKKENNKVGITEEEFESELL